MKYDEVIIQLHNFGYERVTDISFFGQFSVKGSIIQFWSADYSDPISIDFFADNIEKIWLYNLQTKNKIENINEVNIINNKIISTDGEIRIGELVVHIDHGIGIYQGIINKKIGTKVLKYYLLEYANGDELFVPLDKVEKISKYLGISRSHPRLSRLGSKVWEKTKDKVKESIYKLAKELLQVYAQRELIKRPAYKIDFDWDKVIKSSFKHKETPDQEKALKDIYSDLEKDIPMDRLLIGDVGFGKTEVALRTAVQVIRNGKQVVLLAPTTILSRQHCATLKKRLEDFPIKIAELSRFVTKNNQSDIVNDIKNGAVDLAIGTHRLLSSDIKFKNLGLLIVDEEQRFGVKDKEKIKKITHAVDVLSLSATPIPRTLFMSLSGIRQMSAIKTPPKGRKAITTKIEKRDDKNILEHLKFEIDRGGQVYFLHNNVATLQAEANKFQKLLPKARIDFAHGQMTEDRLSEVMSDFATGEIQVLFCSTIIENGLDIENANTLIVDESERFGLSQLYQIRGRIGRGENQAFAYFTFKKRPEGNAFRRLQSLVENSDLGSGFNIAFSDLEIRGGGNILGREQHGNMEEIGLVLYTQLLNLAVERLKSAK